MRYLTPNYRVTFRQQLLFLLCVVLVVAAAGIGSFEPKKAQAATSSTINFQARLMTAAGGIVPDGFYNVEFKIYSQSSGGSAAWTETYYDSNGATAGNDNRVRVANGYLTVNLGSQTAFGGGINWDQDFWITMNVGGTAQTATPTWDGEMNPRLKLTAVPYAFRAGQLAKLTGANTSTLDFDTQTAANNILLPDEAGTLCIRNSSQCGFVTGAATNFIQNTTSQQLASNFYISGDGKATTSLQAPTFDSISGALAIGTGNATSVTLGNATNNTPINLNSGTGTISIGSGAQARTIDIGTGAAVVQTINIGGTGANVIAVGNTQTAGSISLGAAMTTGTITIGGTGLQTGTIGIGTGTGAQSISLGTGGTGVKTIAIGGTAANVITIGNTQTAGSVAIGAAMTTGTITIGGTGLQTGTIGIGTGTGAQSINLGTGGTGIKTIAIGGTAANVITIGNTQTAGSVAIGAAMTTGTVTIGGTGLQTGTIGIGTGTGAQSINLGTGGTGIKTIAIGGTAANVISVGNTQTGGSISLGAAMTTGTVSIGGTGLQTGTINLGVGTGAQSVNLGTGGTGAKTVTVGSTASSGTTTVQGGTGGVNIGTGGIANTVQIGNASGAVAQTINLGTNSNASATNTVVIGDSTATASSVTVNGGTGTGAVTIQAGTGGTINLGSVSSAITQNVNVGANATASSVSNVTVGSLIGVSATVIQSGTGNIVLQSSGAGTVGRIQIGVGGAGSTTPDYLALDVKSDTGDPAGGAEGYMYYNTFDNKFRCYQDGGWVDCINTAAGGVTTIGVIDSQTKSANGAVISGTSLVLQHADASAPGLVSTTTQTFAGDKTFTGTLSVTASNTSGSSLSVSNTALNANGANLANFSFTNANSSATSTAVSGLSITPTGTTNANASANTLNAINLPNVTPIANNNFYAMNVGTGYNDILRYNSTQLISGTGKLQDAAIDSSVTYSNLQKVGALNAGSIATGFGTISTGNNITTTAAVQGGTGIFTGANALTLGTTGTNTGAVVFRGSTGASGTLTLQGPANPSASNYTLSVPAITANANVCTDNSICTGYAAAATAGYYLQQVPTSNTGGVVGANVVAPTANGINGLTVNGTTGTAATAAIIAQAGGADALNVNVTGSSQTNGVLVNRTNAGTLTNALAITNTSGTVTNGLALSGTIGTDITRGSGTLTLQGNGGMTFATNNIVRGTFDTSNNLYLGLGVTAAAPTAFTVAATGSGTAGTAGAALTVGGGAGATTTTGSVGGALNLYGGAAGGSGDNAGGNIVLQAGARTGTGAAGTVLLQNSNDSTTYFNVKTAAGNNMVTVDTVNSRVGIALGGNVAPGLTNEGLEIQGSLRISTSAGMDTYTTPGTSPAGVLAHLTMQNKTLPAGTQMIALGVGSASNDTARGISVFDARTVRHQPTVAVFSPDESGVLGFSWHGSNSIGYVVTRDETGNTDGIALQSGNVTGGTGQTSGQVIVRSGDGGGTNGNTGNVTVDSGTVTGSGTAGSVLIGATNSQAITIGNGTSTSTLQGTIKISALGAATANAAALCRDTSTTNLISCDANTTGKPFLQGGNTFGAAGDLGTNDAFDLNIRRGGTTQLTVGNGSVTLASNADLLLQGASAYISNPQAQTASEAFGLNAAVAGPNSVAVGNSATTHVNGAAVALGASASAGTNAVAIGYSTDAQGNAVTIGYDSSANSGSIALGTSAGASFDRSIAIGRDAATTASNQLVIGSEAGGNQHISHVVIGDGVTSATPNGFTLQGTSGSGSNIAGASVNIAGGQGTGTGAGGNIVFQTSAVGGSGSSLNNLVTRATFDATNNLYLGNGVTAASPNSFTLQGTGSSTTAVAGGSLTVRGGAATVGNANGGSLILSGGAGVGTGIQGLVSIAPATFVSSGTAQTFNSGSGCPACSITGVDSYSTVAVNAADSGLSINIPIPGTANQVVGRIFYLTAVAGSNDFTIILGGTSISIAMKANSTATLIWNGAGWTAAGASSSTDLQSAYNNTLSSAGGAEIVLNNSATSDGLTVRNNATTPIIGAILEAQTSIGSNLLSVNNNATEYATNGGAETAGGTSTTFPSTTWDATTGGTVSRYVTAGDNVATGQASVSVVTTTTNHGARNRLSASLTSGLTYTVSVAVRGATNFSTLQILYSPDGTTTGTSQCTTAETVTSGIWTRIVCTFVASGTITGSNSILIRQTDATARTFYVDNLSVNINASATFAADGSVDDAGTFATNWSDFDVGTGSTTITRETSVIFDTSASTAGATTANTGQGIRNNMAITPAINTQYLVSFYARSTSTMTGSLAVGFLPAGGTSVPSGTAACVDYSTQSLTANTWTKITCLFTTAGTAISNPDLVIYQTDSAARTIYVDSLSITLNTNNSNNVQIGGANKGGPVTLFTLDRSNGAPIAANNEAYLGSLYYDTESGRIQCYEADGWGACGAAPDNIVNLNPEYAGAVLNGDGVGTMTADFCSNDADLPVNDTLCASGQAKNYYRWTSPQPTSQRYSIYVTYQLPATFNGFASDDTVQLVARVDSTSNAEVTYEMFKSTGSDVVPCGTETDVIAGGGNTANAWHTFGINGNESTGCSFNSASAGNFVIFKINMNANSSANAYVSTLSFTTTGR